MDSASVCGINDPAGHPLPTAPPEPTLPPRASARMTQIGNPFNLSLSALLSGARGFMILTWGSTEPA